LSDYWAYKEIAAGIASDIRKKDVNVRPALTGNAAMLADAFNTALSMVGRTGRDVLYGLMESRYELQPADIAEKPGVYMSALRDILDSSANVVEKFVLAEIKEKTGVEAHTLEEAVQKLKAKESQTEHSSGGIEALDIRPRLTHASI
jgi:hypothetical protein